MGTLEYQISASTQPELVALVCGGGLFRLSGEYWHCGGVKALAGSRPCFVEHSKHNRFAGLARGGALV